MRKVLFYSVVALMPALWNPAWGQTESVGKNKTGVVPPNRATSRNQAGNTDQRGTKEFPIVIDTEGHTQTEAERAKADAEHQHVLDVEHLNLRYARITAWSTAALVLVGIGGIGAALKTLNQIQRQADLQERAIRPWIGAASIADGDMRPHGPEMQEVHTTVTLRNTGPSVALNGLMLPFLISSQTAMLPDEIKRVWAETEGILATNSRVDWQTGFVLHPGSTHEHGVSMGTRIQMQELRNGTAYVLVCIIYHDQFGKEHRTQDCFRMTLPDPQSLAVRFKAVPAYQTAS